MNVSDSQRVFGTALSAVVLLFFAGSWSPVIGAPPNVVLIVIDDIGYGDLGCYGNSKHKTPNINRLATTGMRFTDFHSNSCVCSPTRAALLTGQYQQRSGIESAIGFVKDEGMPLAKTTIAEMLAEVGYISGVFGKWHVGHVSHFGPNQQGFETSYVSNNSPDYHTHVSRVGQLDWFANHKPLKEEGYLTDLVTEHTKQFIRQNRQGPFFAFVSHIACHFPFQGPNDPPHRRLGKMWHDTKYGPLPKQEYRRAYRDMLESVDRSVGEMIALLDELNLRENTLILVTSDNGAYSWVGSNGQLRGQKGDLLEGGHRVPLIANWPGRIAQGVVTDATTMTFDIAPTMLALSGVTKPKGLHLDGCDLSPVLLSQGKIPERTLFWRFNNSYTKKHAHAVRQGRWKYVTEEGRSMLFDLGADLAEKHDLSEKHPAIAEKLEQAYVRWQDDVTGSR